MKYGVEIDVSKGKSTVAILSIEGEVIEEPFEINHDINGLNLLEEKLKDISKEDLKIVMEETGTYHLPVLGYLLDKGYFVVAENALKIKKYLDRGLRKAKTDKKDSYKLAEYTCDNWYKLNKARENDETYDNLRFLSRQYINNINVQVKQKNNFSLRLRTVGGHMSAEQLAKVAEVAEKYGEGYVHLTSRQGVEIPFIKLDQIEEVKNALAEGDVVPGVCGPRVRTVTACQGAAICQSGCIDTYALAKELDERYFGYELPHKFKFGITGCQNNCLKAEENDVGIKGGMQVAWVEDKCIQCGVCVKACRNEAITLEDGKISIDTGKCNYCGRCVKSCPVDAYDAQPGYIVSFGGTFGNHISKGETIIPFIESHEKLLKVCDAALKFFEQNGKAGERLKFTIDRTGKEAFEKAIKEAYENE